MKNKNKLKGKKVYVENDLAFEERKRQEMISKWVKEKKSTRNECQSRSRKNSD